MNTQLKLFKILNNDLGQGKVAEILKVSQQEASKKVSGENGLKISQLAQLLDTAGIQLADRDDIVITKAKYEALMVFAREAMEKCSSQ